MKQILLPTDFSKTAMNAVFTATKLYADFECTFILLNTYEPKMQNLIGIKSSTRAGQAYQSLLEWSEKELAKTLSYLTKHQSNKKHRFQSLSIKGDLVGVIKNTIPKYDIDLILMGTQGATGAEAIFLGSNTVKVLKTIKNCTIIVIPELFNFQSLQSIVFATEYVHFFPKNVLQPVLELINQWKSEVKIFHVAQEFKLNDLQQSNKQILKKRFEGCSHSFFKVTIKSTVSKAIRDFASDHDADVIVLTNYVHTFFERLTQEPVVKKVSFKSDVPLLLLPDFEG